MLQLYFPSRKNIIQSTSPQAMLNEEREVFLKNCDELEERAEEMSKDCCLDPSKVTKNDVVELAKDAYSLTVQLIDAKIARGETLYREERAIYDLCKSELQKYSSIEAVNSIELPETGSESQPVGSIWGSLFNAVELVRNCIDQIKDWFNLTTEKDEADRYLVNAGHDILPSYLKAAGLLKIMLDSIPNKKFFVTGHSLGGGLTQFSVTANMNNNSARLTGYGYNPAGLSMMSIKQLENDRLKKAAKIMWIFMTCKDPVSAFGGKIGCLTTLPKTDKNGHYMDDLKECMKKYLSVPAPTPSKNKTITWRSHADADFIPYTHTLSFCDGNGTVYPVFNSNASSSMSNLTSFEILENLFSRLKFATSVQSSCLGVYNKFNGTAHTVMNRILLFTSEEPIITSNSIGNIHSSIIYGKFGLGIPEFTELLRQAYSDSGEAESGSQAAFQELLSHLNNPFEYDKAAWIDGIRIQFGIDMNSMFRQWPLAEPYFNKFIENITADRIDLYRSISIDGVPDTGKIKQLLSGIKSIVVKHATVLMNEGVRWNVFSQSDMNYYMSEIQHYADRVINNV